MRSRHSFLALLLGFGLAALAVAPTPAADSADARKIEKLISQLGSDTFSERQKAAAALDAIGEPALKALQKAAEGEDAEIRKRARELAGKIETWVESARILAPKMVHLVFKDTPVAEAVGDLRKQSGYNVVLHDPENKLKGRKITLDAGKVTFWRALDLLGQKAGLVEGDPNSIMVPPPPGGLRLRPVPLPAPAPGVLPPAPAIKPPAKAALAPARGVAVAVAVEVPARGGARPAVPPAPGGAPAILPAPVPPGGIGGRAVPPGLPRAWVPVQPGQITLLPGKPVERATDSSTSVRVRASDRNVFGPGRAKDIVVTLDVSPEPKLRWQRVMSVRVDKAVDDNDQKLSPSEDAVTAPGVGTPFGGLAPGGAAIMAVLPGRVWMPFNSNGLSRYTVVRLKKGDKASRALKELQGTIAAEVQAEPEGMLEAANILEAADKSFKGKHGGSFKILAVDKAASGQVTIRFEMEQPANVVPEYTPVPVVPVNPALPVRPIRGGAKPALPPAGVKAVPLPGGAGGIAIAIAPGGAVVRPGFLGGYGGITLRDDKDKTLPASIVPNWAKDVAGRKMECQLIYMPQKGHGTPAKLVFTGRRIVAVNIPFSLKDVKLP